MLDLRHVLVMVRSRVDLLFFRGAVVQRSLDHACNPGLGHTLNKAFKRNVTDLFFGISTVLSRRAKPRFLLNGF